MERAIPPRPERAEVPDTESWLPDLPGAALGRRVTEAIFFNPSNEV
jgi:hypothetical protein